MSDEEDCKEGEGGATAFFPFEETTRKSKFEGDLLIAP